MAPDDHCEVKRDKRLSEARQGPKVPGQNQLRLIQKLALNMGMLANDAVVAFCQLYTVPVLQSLGTPVTFVSLTPFISSPLSVLVLPVLGYFSDRGNNLPRRKVFATWVSFFLSVAGLVLISSASMTLLMRSSGANWTRIYNGSTDPNDVHLKTTPTYMVSPDLDLDLHKNAPSAHPAMNAGNASWFLNESDPAHLIRHADSKKQLPLNLSDEDWESGHVPHSHELSNTSTPDNSSHHTIHLPLTAVMGIVGFALTEVGYDASSTSVKSLVVTCSPREAHTSVFVLGLLMAAVGGCLAGITGLTDLSSVLVNTAGE
nr:hypothetical protein BaRGS_035325 [Batillaria attramentaria]